MVYPARAAEAEGVRVELAPDVPIVRAQRKSDMRWVIAPDRVNADVIVLQRPSNPELVALIPALQQQGHAVVVDVDDDVGFDDPASRAAGDESRQMVARACALADMVTVSTPALARRFGAHGRVAVLENCVPERLLGMPHSSDGRTVGWAGWVGTHPHDLQVTHGGVAQALEDTGARFQMIGPPDGVRSALSLAEEPDATGGVPIDSYHRLLGCLDVGIAPLADTAFNAAKSGLKPLEMTARGAAVVMSPRSEYAGLADDGIGVLAADRSRSWRGRVRGLIEDPALRAQMVAHGRRAIAELYTYEGNAWAWVEAWQAAVDRRLAKGRSV
jgi:glycosyltransferase involved in cell wall biosynthesis